MEDEKKQGEEAMEISKKEEDAEK
ncbi:hypothetical protein A2U01_0091603, partial [Trifolium medium]|nr:hypothetical protein [Trifolium medium]